MPTDILNEVLDSSFSNVPVLVTSIMAELCSTAAWLAGAATAPRVLVTPSARVNGTTLRNLFTCICLYAPLFGFGGLMLRSSYPRPAHDAAPSGPGPSPSRCCAGPGDG